MSANQIERWGPNQPLDHRRLNKHLDATITEITVGPGLTLHRVGNSVVIGLAGKPSVRPVDSCFVRVDGVGAPIGADDAYPHAWHQVAWSKSLGAWQAVPGGLSGTTEENYLVHQTGRRLTPEPESATTYFARVTHDPETGETTWVTFGGRIDKLRFDSASNNLQVSFTDNPEESDWHAQIQFEECEEEGGA